MSPKVCKIHQRKDAVVYTIYNHHHHQRNLKTLGNQQSSWWDFSPNIENKQTIFLSFFHSNQNAGRLLHNNSIVMLSRLLIKIGNAIKTLCHVYLPGISLNLIQIFFHYSLFSGTKILQTPILFPEQPVQIRVFIQRFFVVADLPVMVKCPANAICKEHSMSPGLEYDDDDVKKTINFWIVAPPLPKL